MSNIATYLPLLSAVLVFFLGFFVWSKGRKEGVNFTFALFAFVITIWMFGTFMMFLNKSDKEVVIFWDKIVYVGVVFIPVIMLHFGLAMTGDKSKKGRTALILGYMLSTFFLALIPTKLFVSDAFVYQWGAHTKAQFFHHIFLVYFAIYLISWFIIVWRYFKRASSSVERERIKYSFLAFLILAIFGSLGYLPAYGVSIYPFAYLSGFFFVVVLAYAIVVHHLMDIKLALRQSFVYAFSILAILVPAGIATYYAEKLFQEYIILVSLVILLVAVSVYPSIRNWYYRIANKYFFSSLYDVREVITKLSDGLRSTLDVTEVYNFISRTLIGTFHTKAVGVLNYDAVSGQYAVQFNSGFLLGDRKIFSGDKILQEEYIKKSKIVVVEEIKSVAYERHKEMIDTLMGLGAAVVVPLNIKDEMLGVMVLGNKESGDMFNDEDLRTLETVASQAAIAIKNAQLYGETRGFSVTLQKEVERQTKQLKEANVELQKLDKAKSDFISIASHQLRTPLTAIKGFTSMILEGSYGRVTNVVRDKLEKIFESTERLVRLVNDLLDLSHMEGGGMEYNFAKVDFDAMVRSVVEELTPPAEKKKLKFKWRTPDENIWVWADEQKLRQVVMNLIDNAIKYTPQGAVDVILERVDGNVQMSVKDTGMGMKKSELANLFQKFVRGTEAPRYYTEGAGIGLYVAKQLIEAQKGEVWAESPGEDKGSTFFVKMPEMKGGTS